MSNISPNKGPSWTGAPLGVPVRYYEDLQEGYEQWGGETLVNREDMIAYAKEFDPWPFHTEERLAKESIFGKLVASGGYTIGLWFKLGHQLLNDFGEVWALMGGIEWKLRFVCGVEAGIRLRFMRRVTRKRPSTKPGRGVIFLHSKIVNQDIGKPVITLEEVVLIAKRTD